MAKHELYGHQVDVSACDNTKSPACDLDVLLVFTISYQHTLVRESP